MYFTPIVIKNYKIPCSKNDFIKELRRNTREPYFDNKTSRRQDTDDKLLFANEFDNFIFLKCEIVGNKWVTPKTLLYIRETASTLKVISISYPGGFGGAFYIGFGLSAILVFGIQSWVKEGNINSMLAFVGLYVLCTLLLNPEFIEQNSLVKKLIEHFKNNPSTN